MSWINSFSIMGKRPKRRTTNLNRDIVTFLSEECLLACCLCLQLWASLWMATRQLQIAITVSRITQRVLLQHLGGTVIFRLFLAAELVALCSMTVTLGSNIVSHSISNKGGQEPFKRFAT